MKLKPEIKSLSIEDSNIIKGIGILLIAFHNFFHWTLPNAKENEFDFSIHGVQSLIHGIQSQPLESINLLFSFWGHFGVQLFIFISGYGLMKAYQNQKISWGAFMSKRINKLWPAFFFALFLFYSLMRILMGNSLFSIHLLELYTLRISFLSNFFFGKQFMLNGPWWFYSMIVQLYMVFPFLAWLQKKYPKYGLLIITGLSYFITILFNPWFVQQDSSLYLFFLSNIPVFSLGIFLGSKDKFTYNHLYGIGAFILFLLGNFYQSFWYFSHLMFSIFALAFIYFLFLQKKQSNYLTKTILFYGELSMYFYAVHGFIRPPFVELANNSSSALMHILWAIVFIAISTLVALALKWVVNNYLRILHWASARFKNIESKSFGFIIKAISRLMQIGFVFIIMLLILRIYEFSILKYHHEMPGIDIDSLLNVCFRDFLAGIAILAWLLIPYIIVYRFFKKAVSILLSVFFGLIIIASIIVIQYYDFTLNPLDSVIYVYSFESILEIISSAGISILSILAFVVGILAFVFLLIISKKIQFKLLFVIAFPFIAIAIAFIPHIFIPKENSFDSEIAFTYTNNKLFYFINDVSQYSPGGKHRLEEVAKASDAYHRMFPERKYINPNFPFLRKKDIGNPLGAFFNKTKSGNPPNIVFLFIESLCPTISGPHAYTASFTPFLDSLTSHSLFWRNNLSSAERTFGILPSALASLPFGENGFLDLSHNMPAHQSIINILESNNYSSRFFYGGWPHFNNMDVFMKLNKIDTIINQFDDKDSIPPNENGFSWGFSDGAIFRSTFNTIKDSTNPYLSIYLTLSTHSPFKIKHQDEYIQRVHKRLDDLGIVEEQREKFIKNEDKLATFIYLDDEFRNFFKQYAKRKDFENTIFIITGDHRGIIFERISKIDAYHTPLIIYSPMLKKAHEFGGVCSHLDLTPTLLNYLEDDYKIKTPDNVSWLGGLIDTSTDFHSQVRMAFMRNNRSMRDFIDGDYYLSDNSIYKVSDNLNLEKIENPDIKKQLKDNLANFKIINSFTIEGVATQTQYNINTLVSEDLDFENQVSDYYAKDTSCLEANSGKFSMWLRKDQDYGSICPCIEIGDGVSRIYINISFKVLAKNYGKNKPIFVIDLQKDDKHIEWFGLEFMEGLKVEEKWNRININKTLFVDSKSSKGSILKLYLWNKDAGELFYDDLKIEVKVKQQQKKQR